MHIEKGFKVVKITSLGLELTSLLIVFTDGIISIFDDLWGGVLDVVWAVLLEVHSVFSNLDLKLSKSILDVSCFLVLKRKDSFFDWSERLLTDVDKGCLGVLKLNEEIFVHLKSMLFKENNGLFHWLNLIESSILDHLDIS